MALLDDISGLLEGAELEQDATRMTLASLIDAVDPDEGAESGGEEGGASGASSAIAHRVSVGIFSNSTKDFLYFSNTPPFLLNILYSAS